MRRLAMMIALNLFAFISLLGARLLDPLALGIGNALVPVELLSDVANDSVLL